MSQSSHPPSLLESNARPRVFAPAWLPPLSALAAAGTAYALGDDPLTRVLVPLAVALGCWALAAAVARLRPPVRWRVTELGLHKLRGGRNVTTHVFTAAQPLVLTVPELALRRPLDYGAGRIGDLSVSGATGMRMSAFPLHLALRRLGIPLRLADEKDAAPGQAARWEARFSRREAALLGAAAEGPLPAAAGDTVELVRPGREVRTRQFAGRLVPLLTGLVALAVAAVPSDGAVPERVTGINACAVLVLVWTAGSYARSLRLPPVRWTIGPRSIRVNDPWFGAVELSADRIAAVVPERITEETATGTTRTSVAVQFYGHDLTLLGTAHSGDLPWAELLSVLRSRGYRVLEDAPDGDSAYDLDPGFLPHQAVPDGRFTLAAEHIGWEGPSGAVRVPRPRVGALEVHTRSGHAWLRVRSADGTEALYAPLAALRISRSELRERARTFGYPLTDPEHDAYSSAAFASLAAGAAYPVPDRTAAQPPPPPGPRSGTGGPGGPVVVSMPASTRWWYYGGGAAGGAALAAILGVKLRHLVDGGMSWLAWGLPAGLALGGLLGLLHDLRRPAVVLGPDGVRLAARGGRGGTSWAHPRTAVGGVAVDSHEGEESLYVWSTAGQVIRKESVHVPDPQELRRGCERAGLPWGRPDFGRVSPPPEL
ncbi:hypothetical protein HUT19_06065 [Streptomyces sp. NA02950]|uniref:hypothetical protein n=1 Tax=Streptomyces sp. NA02950 TaxID=2742137 RepID=UPI0015929563|nr:hypothetical protein [Streptomyces sp. NA02950]QKV91363.1 hypothetical protein HUT19_06065 [Streptomyces sp. NA02950]